LNKTRTLNEIRSLARSHTRTAINVLVGIMRSKDMTAAARVSAANAILDRGWGKATQPLKHSSDGALELIHRIDVGAYLSLFRCRCFPACRAGQRYGC
jgi:hypothetical protein